MEWRSNFDQMENSIGKIKFASWVIIVVCGAVLAFALVLLPETQAIRSRDRETRLERIESIADVGGLRRELHGLVHVASSTSTTAWILGVVSIVAFLVSIANCAIILKSVRRVERGEK